jgi:nucleotide-binding universal stress UspA family protein
MSCAADDRSDTGNDAYRRALLDKSPRAKAVLDLAAQRAGWGKPLPPGSGRGVSVQFAFASYLAQARWETRPALPNPAPADSPVSRKTGGYESCEIMGMIKHILLTTDGSAFAEDAAMVAISLAKQVGARITALYVPPPYAQTLENPAEVLEDVQFLAKDEGVEFAGMIQSGQPWEAILKTAMDLKPDLIAMPAHGGETPANAVIDGDTTRVIVNTRIPVLLCR